jgi:PAS domain S-box-containing protein
MLSLEKGKTNDECRFAEKLPIVVFFALPDGTLEYISQGWIRLTGVRMGERLDEQWRTVQHPEDRARVEWAWSRSIRTGEKFTAEFQIRTGEGLYRWHLANAVPFREAGGAIVRWYGTLVDIHEHKRLENAQRFLSDAARELAVSLDQETTLHTIARLTIPKLADFCDVSLVSDQSLRSVAWAAGDISVPLWIREVVVSHPSVVQDRDFGPGRVLWTRKPEIVDTIPAMILRKLVTKEEEPALLRMAESQSVLLIPLVSGNRALGVMTLAFTDAARRYTPEDIPVACEFASRAVLALENARTYTIQLELATELQMALLPADLPTIEGIMMSSYYQPAGAVSRVGGDWYDAFVIDDDRVAFSIGDVAGHGTHAAMAMGEMRRIIRGGLLEGETLLASLMRANTFLLIHNSDVHVTALLAVLDRRTKQMVYANAGHPPALLRYCNGSVESLGGHGMPLGIISDMGLSSAEVSIPPGASIVFYTDGLIETHGDVVAGMDGLISVVASLSSIGKETAAEIARKLLPRRTHQDDVALMTIFVS